MPSRITVSRHDNRLGATVSLPTKDGIGVSVDLATDQIDDLLLEIRKSRVDLLPRVSRDPPELFDRVTVYPDIQYEIWDAPMDGQCAFFLRHPAFGWIVHTMKPDDAFVWATKIRDIVLKWRDNSAGTPGTVDQGPDF